MKSAGGKSCGPSDLCKRLGLFCDGIWRVLNRKVTRKCFVLFCFKITLLAAHVWRAYPRKHEQKHRGQLGEAGILISGGSGHFSNSLLFYGTTTLVCDPYANVGVVRLLTILNKNSLGNKNWGWSFSFLRIYLCILCIWVFRLHVHLHGRNGGKWGRSDPSSCGYFNWIQDLWKNKQCS